PHAVGTVARKSSRSKAAKRRSFAQIAAEAAGGTITETRFIPRNPQSTYALCVARLFTDTVRPTAHATATLKPASGVLWMNKAELKREARYIGAIEMAKTLLENGTITEDDYERFAETMKEKYRPQAARLFAEIT
ncbi:MAG: SHOCT domain-containing protein, partial [Atopobium minutum]|nr:SHOCT domain-containing protein [Atopobium minutum]